MPPLRTERAGKACDTCRRQKTRCYPSEKAGTCLRCKTLQQACSLRSNGSPATKIQRVPTSESSSLDDINEKLARLEQSMNILIERTTDVTDESVEQANENVVSGHVSRQSSTEGDPAPVIMIRNAANAMVTRPLPLNGHEATQVVSNFTMTPAADELLSLFHEHYGRWVRFEEGPPTGGALTRLKASRLLLCSILLIVVRHSTVPIAGSLTSALLVETKALLGHSLLSVVDSLDIFRALLILSLWSTSVGGEPMGIDGWLLTSYAINHARASPVVEEVFKRPNRPLNKTQLDAWCIWNHLCVAHLQYCVGTRRLAILDSSTVTTCSRLLKRYEPTLLGNFETRMIAEVKLYFIIYQQCMGQLDRNSTEQQLSAWKMQWAELFEQARAQFLQMGYYFALLLTLARSIRSRRETISSNLDELIRLITSILHLATETVDERAQYLTDHIYHIVVFSALTLCQILIKHEQSLQKSHDVPSLDSLLYQTVEWLRSIGSPSHVTNLLARVIESQHRKTRPQQQPLEPAMSTPDLTDSMFAYPDYLMTDLYDFDNGSEDQRQSWQDLSEF